MSRPQLESCLLALGWLAMILAMRELAFNRPVFLAARDACYEKGAALLRGDLMSIEVRQRLEVCDAIVAVLRQARQNADFAWRGIEASRQEKHFAQYLELLSASAQSLLVMTRHEHLLTSDRQLLREFLGQNAVKMDKYAAHHRGLAAQIVDAILQLTAMADTAYNNLKGRNLKELGSDEAQARYQRAFESFRKVDQ